MARNSRVYVKGTGEGIVVEVMAGMLLVQFAHAMAWIDSRIEEVKLCAAPIKCVGM